MCSLAMYPQSMPLYVHILNTVANCDDTDHGPMICSTIQRTRGALWCLAGVDSSWLNRLTQDLPVHYTCFFRARNGEHEAIIMASSSLACAVMASLCLRYALVYLHAVHLVYLLNPFIMTIGLHIAYIMSLIILKMRNVRRWAFAVENDVGFCITATRMDYWKLCRVRNTKYSSAARDIFTVMGARDRWSGCMCKVVLLRLPVMHDTHIPLICDAIQLAYPHAASRRAMSIIILLLPPIISQAHIECIQKLLSSAKIRSKCSQSQSVVVGIASSTFYRWEKKSGPWCKGLRMVEGSSARVV
jgi:hypothetical protein